MPGDLVKLGRELIALRKAEREFREYMLTLRRDSDHGLHRAVEFAWKSARARVVKTADKMRRVAAELGDVHAPLSLCVVALVT
jgi:hypothetical protein